MHFVALLYIHGAYKAKDLGVSYLWNGLEQKVKFTQ